MPENDERERDKQTLLNLVFGKEEENGSRERDYRGANGTLRTDTELALRIIEKYNRGMSNSISEVRGDMDAEVERNTAYLVRREQPVMVDVIDQMDRFEAKINSDPIELSDYVLLPGQIHGDYSYPDLLVAKERTSFGATWNTAHYCLARSDQFMFTIRQFVDFVNMLRSGDVYNGDMERVESEEVEQILDEIVGQRDPCRGEWLDAHFRTIAGLYIAHSHKLVRNELFPQYMQPLQEHVMHNSFVDFFGSANDQGLPTRKGMGSESCFFWHPSNGDLAKFMTTSEGSYFGSGNLEQSSSIVGVRPIKKYSSNSS